jgi:hypothetical protein
MVDGVVVGMIDQQVVKAVWTPEGQSRFCRFTAAGFFLVLWLG